MTFRHSLVRGGRGGMSLKGGYGRSSPFTDSVCRYDHVPYPLSCADYRPSLYLVVIELFWLQTKEETYYRMYRFWVKIFAINFGVGVVTGIVLEFESGTNFSQFSQAVSNPFSPSWPLRP